MRNKILIAGLLAAVAAPTLAFAQADPNCVRSNQETSATGTVLGAVGGALIGNAIAGRHNRGVGTVGGALAGGVAGNLLAGQHNDPCPEGYYRPAPANYPPPPSRYEGFWRGGPGGIHERMDFMQERIERAYDNGWLSRREAHRANDDLRDIRRQEDRLRYRDEGHLSPEDRDYLQSRLDNLSERIRWDEHNN